MTYEEIEELQHQAYEDGYEECAREIFEEFEKALKKINRIVLNDQETYCGEVKFYFMDITDFAELKKKYKGAKE